MNNLIKSLQPYGTDAVIHECRGYTIVGSHGYNKFAVGDLDLPPVPDGYFFAGGGFRIASCENPFSKQSYLFKFNGRWKVAEDGFTPFGSTDCDYCLKATPENIKNFVDLVCEYGGTAKKQKTMNKNNCIFSKAAELQALYEKIGKRDFYVNNQRETFADSRSIGFALKDEVGVLTMVRDGMGDRNVAFDLNTKFLSVEDYEKANLIKTSFKINGYFGEYIKGKKQWQFGCAKISKKLIENAFKFCIADSGACYGTDFKFCTHIQIGIGKFSKGNILEMYKLQKA